LSTEELDKYIKAINHLDNTLNTLQECQDMFLSDLSKLETLRFRLTEVLDWLEKTIDMSKPVTKLLRTRKE